MSVVYVEAVGLFAPGLVGWANSREVLAGERAYSPAESEPLPKYKPTLLPANERRRATGLVRLAFGACEDAIGERRSEVSALASVFAASGGDYTINDQICRALLEPDPMLSPTQFHNSVHNAAAGYWSIATQSQAPSVSLSAYDFTVAAGFVEAITLATLEGWPTLLALFDNDICWPMGGARPVNVPFSAALWLTPERSASSLAAISMALEEGPRDQSPVSDPNLESLRLGNPAARCIPLLQILSRNSSGSLYLDTAGGQSLRLDVTPC